MDENLFGHFDRGGVISVDTKFKKKNEKKYEYSVEKGMEIKCIISRGQ